MNKQSTHFIDSVSASELIKALTTLQHLSQQQIQNQVSFCNLSQFQNNNIVNNLKTISFQSFMADQTKKPPQNKPISRKSISPYRQRQRQRVISPLKQRQHHNNVNKVVNMKSRSHSPLQKKIGNSDKTINKYGKFTPRKSVKQHKKQQSNQKENMYPCLQSKKILQQKHPLGINYIPIQHRAEYLLRQKQAKISKLQKEKEISRIMEEKECTFRPNISKKIKRQIEPTQDEYHRPTITAQEIMKFDQCFINLQNACSPTEVKEESMNSDFEVLKKKGLQVSEYDQTKLICHKFKNQKFNHLIGFIH